MDSGRERSVELSGLSMADGAEASSTAGGSSKDAMEGEGQRVPGEEPKVLPGKVQKDDPELLEARDYTNLFAEGNLDDNIQKGISKVTGWFHGVTFEECLLDNSTFTDCRMTNVTFRGCTFKHTTWAELDLKDMTFEDCLFEEHLWRCCSLSGSKFIKRDFLKETSLGGDIPLEIDSAFWLKTQQYAYIAASEGGDEALARYVRAKKEEEHDRQLASHFSAEGDASIEWVPDAKTCQEKWFQKEDAARRARWVPSPLNSCAPDIGARAG